MPRLPMITLALLAAVSPALTATTQGQLALELYVETERGGTLAFVDDSSLLSIAVALRNHRDWPVQEGSTRLAHSLEVAIFASNGDEVARWLPEEDCIIGQPRVWAPDEREVLRLFWPYRVSQLFESEAEAIAAEGDPVPLDGYRVMARWRDFGGEFLSSDHAWIERLPGNREDWGSGHQFVRTSPPAIYANSAFSIVGESGCASTPSHATSRFVEIADNDTVKVHVDRYCGPFSSPSTFPLAVAVPPLHFGPGQYTVELWLNMVRRHGVVYSRLYDTGNLIIMEQPVSEGSASDSE